MKIVQVVPRFWPSIGGAETMAYEISTRLVKRGHEVIVLTSRQVKNQTSARTKTEDCIKGVKILRFNSHRFAKNDAGFIIEGLIRALSRERGISIVHSHSYGYFSSYTPPLFRMIHEVPLIYSPYFAPELATFSIIRRLFDATLGAFSFKMSDYVLTLTEKEKEQLVKRFTVDPARVSVIPPGIDLERFQGTVEGKQFRTEFGIEDKKLVLFVGRVIHTKGLSYLVQAIPRVLSLHPDSHFVIVGEDWGHAQHLKDLAVKLEVEHALTLTGPLFDPLFVGAYQAADVFVHPSVSSEAYGITVTEAMSAGKPVIATNVGGRGSLIEEGKNGFLVPPANSGALSNKISFLLGHPRLAQKVGTRGAKLAQTFSWEHHIDKLESIYQDRIERI